MAGVEGIKRVRFLSIDYLISFNRVFVLGYSFRNSLESRVIITNSFLPQKMAQLREEADQAVAQVEELSGKVKALEQENLTKDQEIRSLSHKNQLLEEEVDKLETSLSEAKAASAEGSAHSKTNENLTRKMQILEDEAEEAQKKLKSTNEAYAKRSTEFSYLYLSFDLIDFLVGCAKPTSKLVTTNERYKRLRFLKTSGYPNMKKCQRNMRICRRQ